DCPAPLITAAKTRGMRVSFGYGLTETSSGVALSLGEDPYAMTVCPDDRITIAADGEILIEAPTCVMQGYFNRPEETGVMLQNGVLHTGDLGRFDAQGLLHITGRKKEILVLSDGTKIYLPEYEQDLGQALPGRDLAVFLWKGSPILLVHGDPSEKEALFQKIRGVISARPRGQQIKDIFFSAKPLPRTAAGKLRRWELNKTEEVQA
ncbi:MAG: AMP-binding protein, partial [Lachnospiraceae bacterium]|nr:AMP-binding protein [Lachnospiraceae bacterium]